jgi:hypothetical protein
MRVQFRRFFALQDHEARAWLLFLPRIQFGIACYRAVFLNYYRGKYNNAKFKHLQWLLGWRVGYTL